MNTSAPSCCAGLRQALLHGWQYNFPLVPSPFQVVAQRCGSTLNEVLQLGQRLQGSGSLLPLRPRWGSALYRCHQRWGLHLTAEERARWWPTLAADPACIALLAVAESRGGAPGVDIPTLWVDLLGRDALVGQALLLKLQAAGHHPLWVGQFSGTSAGVPQASQPCGCDTQSGPCQDPALATALEAGLPLKAHPYTGLAKQLGRSERQVLASLKQWQQQGSLEGLALTGPDSGMETSGALACLPGQGLDTKVLARLRQQSGVHEVAVLPIGDSQPPGLWLRVQAPADLAWTQLHQALQAVGLAEAPGLRQRFAGLRPRTWPALFNPGITPQASTRQCTQLDR